MRKDEYFFTWPADRSQDARFIALEQVYGFEGYGRYVRLWEFLRMQPEYRLDINQKFSWSSLSQILKTNIADCKRFIDDCIKEFDLVATDDQYIWCQELKDRMTFWDDRKRVLSERGRKGAEVTNKKKAEKSAQATLNVGTSDGTSEENEQHERRLSGQNRQHRIEKNRKEKNRKEDKSNTGADAPVKDNNKPKSKKLKLVVLFWEVYTDTWFSFFEKKFGRQPTFNGAAAGSLKSIAVEIEKRSKAEIEAWDAAAAKETFTRFLEKAFEDPWTKSNFLLPTLWSHFDKHFTIKPSYGNSQTSGPNGATGGQKPGKGGSVAALQALKRNNQGTTFESTGRPGNDGPDSGEEWIEVEVVGSG